MKSLNAAARHSHNFLVNKQHFKKHKASKEDTRARFNRKPRRNRIFRSNFEVLVFVGCLK